MKERSASGCSPLGLGSFAGSLPFGCGSMNLELGPNRAPRTGFCGATAATTLRSAKPEDDLVAAAEVAAKSGDTEGPPSLQASRPVGARRRHRDRCPSSDAAL